MGAFITFRRAGLLVIFTLAVAASSVAGQRPLAASAADLGDAWRHWFVLKSMTGFSASTVYQWGSAGDISPLRRPQERICPLNSQLRRSCDA